YTEEQWQLIDSIGNQVDARLEAGGVGLTMGSEPTFVSIDDMEGDEWKTAAVGPMKRRLSGLLIERLKQRFAPGGLLHYGQGKWYPGESLPRWALTCLWRNDGVPLWMNDCLLAESDKDYGHTAEDAERFATALAQRLGVNADHVSLAYEDALYYIWKERRLPANADLADTDLEDEEERARIARVFERGLKTPVGCMLPLVHQWWNAKPTWASGLWPVRSEHLFLIPGDSPMGLRLPLDSLPAETTSGYSSAQYPSFEQAEPLPAYEQLRQLAAFRRAPANVNATVHDQVLQHVGPGGEDFGESEAPPDFSVVDASEFEAGIVRTALCVEPRDGVLHVFMPPVDRLESYLELLTAIEQTAEELDSPIMIEGYLPPHDHRLSHLKVTPDPGVVEVNVHPASSWRELVDITWGLYEDARQSRLGTEKFDTDGTHTGTGGGNHVVLGARTPADSPFLRRPDLLRSLVAYWNNHPSLSYLFSGRFVGPTSQAPRADEGRRDSIYELQIAFEQIPKNGQCAPWIVDRVFRHLLVDLTGNTHRAEFCIDKLYSPDTAQGRLGLVEFRAFEMPPHWQMSLTQQLFLRSLVARFWNEPYEAKLVDWNTSVHDRWVLPHFVHADFADVIEETRAAGIPLDSEWFEPHFEFKFPLIGELDQNGIAIEVRAAIEPWYVLGEEPAGGYSARYVDSSVERLQVKASGMTGERHVITCNGRRLPLHPTGTEGEYVAGVRYRAWQPPSCLHPTIPVDEPLVFDILDTWMDRSIGGCTYHVSHPGGLNPTTFPVNSFEAESRRAARFFKTGHTGGKMQEPAEERNPAFPMTLDLRRNRAAV
ncbi:MAG: transglutaminase family protein, partial [Pirellulales bacterium]|nr:transglutaminase family protein [Pirellulales bacterium]